MINKLTKPLKISYDELIKRKIKYNNYIDSAKNLFEKFIDERNPFTISLIDKEGTVLLTYTSEKNKF